MTPRHYPWCSVVDCDAGIHRSVVVPLLTSWGDTSLYLFRSDPSLDMSLMLRPRDGGDGLSTRYPALKFALAELDALLLPRVVDTGHSAP